VSEHTEYKPLSREELEAIAGEELPERAAMSLVNANIAAPINAAVALTWRATTRSPTRTRSRPATSPSRSRRLACRRSIAR
jgi:hypothetical protein